MQSLMFLALGVRVLFSYVSVKKSLRGGCEVCEG